jgi:hypothetical protein
LQEEYGLKEVQWFMWNFSHPNILIQEAILSLNQYWDADANAK